MKKLILFGAAISISVAVSAQHIALKNNLVRKSQAFQALAGTAGIPLLDL